MEAQTNTMQKQDIRMARRLETVEVVKRIPDDVKPYAYLVGVWVWLEFESKPAKEVREAIKAIGFRWNKRREVWQHPCGVFRKRTNGDPRNKYGSIKLDGSYDVKEHVESANEERMQEMVESGRFQM